MNLCYVFYLLLFIELSHSVEVSLTLQSLINITQHPNIANIVLKPGQIYQHYSDLLQPLPYLNNSCHAFRGQLVSTKVVDFPMSNVKDNIQHVYVEKYGIIYRLEQDIVSAFQFSQANKKLTFIQKFNLNMSLCKNQIALSNDQEYLYHFGCMKITRIEVKKSMTSVKTVEEMVDKFNGYKVINGPDFILWLSYNQGIKIYTVDTEQNIKLIQTLLKFQGKNAEQKIVDGVFRDNKLFALGMERDLFVFEKVGNGSFISKRNISLTNICSECNHRRILVHNKNIYIYSVETGEQFVTQLQYEKELEKVSLIRYFKGNRNFADMTIFEGRLMIGFSHVINLYEINKDPRTINKLFNGISNVHIDEMSKFERISQKLYIEANDQFCQLVRLSIKKPYYECKYEEEFKEPKQLQLKQSCQELQNINDQRYYYQCQRKEIINITVEKEKESHHLLVVILVFLFCAIVVGILIIWRKEKISIIQNIVIQINKLKRNSKESIEFVEEKGSVKESNWNDVQSIEGSEQKQSGGAEMEKQQQNPASKQSSLQEPVNQENEKIQGTERQMIEEMKNDSNHVQNLISF